MVPQRGLEGFVMISTSRLGGGRTSPRPAGRGPVPQVPEPVPGQGAAAAGGGNMPVRASWGSVNPGGLVEGQKAPVFDHGAD